jgi:hypothetical protein
MSNFLATAIIGHIWGKSTFTPATTWYAALCKTAPSASDTGSTISESNYTNYVRKSFVGTDLSAVIARTVSSVNTLTFAAPGASGDTVNGFAICDAATLGNMLYFGTLPTTVIPANGTAPSIPSGSLTFTAT